MSDSVNEHTAELRIVFQGPTGSFTNLSTIAKKPWKPDCCCLVRIRDDPYLSWVGQGNSCKPRSRVSTFEAGGYTAKSENRSARWWCTVGETLFPRKWDGDENRLRMVVQTSNHEAGQLRENTEKYGIYKWMVVWCIEEAVKELESWGISNVLGQCVNEFG